MPDVKDLTFTSHDDLLADAAAVVDAGLHAANLAAAPLEQVRPLASFARLSSGEVIGGAVGRTWGSCCELQQFWVADEFRRQGVGTRLIREFEQRAAERGCDTVYLETYSFQSPRFYHTLGYEVALELPGHGDAIIKYIMVRQVLSVDVDA